MTYPACTPHKTLAMLAEEPMTLPALADAIGVPRDRMGKALRNLRRGRKIVSTGKRGRFVYSLPPHRAPA